MRWRTFSIQREPGFRLNLIDLALIAAVLGVSFAWWRVFPDQHLYLLPVYVGFSFFLFCNVFRIGNRMEPPWYLCFGAMAAWGMTQPEFPWLALLAVCESVKWALIGWRLWRGPYYGAFHREVAAWKARRARMEAP
jgi:hypothetical protein